MSDADVKRRAARDAREMAELADAIERCWRSRFRTITVLAQIELERMRRGDRGPPSEDPENEAAPEERSGARNVCQDEHNAITTRQTRTVDLVRWLFVDCNRLRAKRGA